MYETIRKRRVKITLWSKEAQQEDLKAKEKYNKPIDEGNGQKSYPVDEFKFPHEKGCGYRDRFGWFCGYGLDMHETNEQVASYTVAIVENDFDGVELIPVSCITFIP